NGAIGSGDSASLACTNCVIFNNTIVNTFGPAFFEPAATGLGSIFRDNIIWNSSCDVTTGSSLTHDTNSYLSCTDTPPTETNRQVTTLNPFVNSSTKDWHLSNGTSVTAGWSVGAPSSTDVT